MVALAIIHSLHQLGPQVLRTLESINVAKTQVTYYFDRIKPQTMTKWRDDYLSISFLVRGLRDLDY